MAAFPDSTLVLIHVPARAGYLRFTEPLEILSTVNPEEVPALLRVVDKLVISKGYYAAGFLAYEAAPGLDAALQVKAAQVQGMPLTWFGIYQSPVLVPVEKVKSRRIARSIPWQAEIAAGEYDQSIALIRDQIACGNTYQVNYTYRLRTPFSAAPYPYFAALVEAHRPPYAAYLESEDWAVCSFSPELFFSLRGDILTSRPMKGTAPRGTRWVNDLERAEWLKNSEKNRAENVMIVDMMRNDLGRIARTGTVHVPQLFQVEKYPTVWQMTSTVQAETEATGAEIFQALFPSASITGAPKVKTMELIARLERSPRQVYCGAIGYFAPGREAQFNVAIRTLLVDKNNHTAEYGVGGGIVWDSEARNEWEETEVKARILHERPGVFRLLETLRWTPEEGWFLVEQHLERLCQSAAYFAYPLDESLVRRKLARLAERFGITPQRARLTLNREGKLQVKAVPLMNEPDPTRIKLARTPVDTADRFLYHKTTRRDLYQLKLREVPGADDVLLWNERGDLTEATIANLVYEWKGRLYTPPVDAGLLPGTYRAWLLAAGKVFERNLPKWELAQCSRVFLVNSVRGMWEIPHASIECM